MIHTPETAREAARAAWLKWYAAQMGNFRWTELTDTITAAILKAQEDALEACKAECAVIADNPPDIDVARPHWHAGHQDGAMDCVAAIEALIPKGAS